MSRTLLVGSFTALATVAVIQVTQKESTIEQYKRNSQSIVRVGVGRGWGTGVITYTPSGKKVVITNDHVCFDFYKQRMNKDLIAYDAADKVVSRLRVLVSNSQYDLCAAEMIDSTSLPALTPSERAIDRFSHVHMIGFPTSGAGRPVFGPSDGYAIKEGFTTYMRPVERPSCPVGSVLVDTSVSGGRGLASLISQYNCLQTVFGMEITARSFPGNSGSLVFTDSNEYVGILSGGDPYTNNGMFIPGRNVISLIKGL